MKSKKNIPAFIWNHLEELVGGTLLVLILLDLTYQVILRYVFSSGNSWSEELARYGFIWLIFLGTSLAAMHGEHIKIDFLIGIWPKRWRKYFHLVGDLLSIAFSFVILYFGWKYTVRIFATNQFGPGTFIPMGYIYMAIPVCYALMIVRMSVKFVQDYILKKPALPDGETSPAPQGTEE